MLRTNAFERTYVLLKYDSGLNYPLCYEPLVYTNFDLERNVLQIIRNKIGCGLIQKTSNDCEMCYMHVKKPRPVQIVLLSQNSHSRLRSGSHQLTS